MTYEGWSNFPTWAVNLWLSNDEGLYKQTLELIDSYDSSSWADSPGLRSSVLANGLKEWVYELAPDLGATFAADLLSYALGEVDWYELAQAWGQTYQEVT